MLAGVVNVDSPLTDGDRGTSGASDGVELPYNKLTRFKLFADELDDSSCSFIADAAGLIGDFDRLP